jgi:hypothetical protein
MDLDETMDDQEDRANVLSQEVYPIGGDNQPLLCLQQQQDREQYE